MKLRSRDEISGLRLVLCVFATLTGLVCTPLAFNAYQTSQSLLDSPPGENRALHESLAERSKTLLIGSAILLIAGPIGFIKRTAP